MNIENKCAQKENFKHRDTKDVEYFNFTEFSK